MSRLDSFIRRLEAQRSCLALAVERSRHVPGVVLELGLGNGRTFDHLREICAGGPQPRDIHVFDRQVAAHPDCIPAPDRLFLGDFTATLKQARARLGDGSAALIHVDLGSGDDAASRALALVARPRHRAADGAGRRAGERPAHAGRKADTPRPAARRQARPLLHGRKALGRAGDG
jgi:hypothetical protein